MEREGYGVKCNETKDSYTLTQTIDTHIIINKKQDTNMKSVDKDANRRHT